MRVVFAPDSFKGTASAVQVAAALVSGWASIRPGDECLSLPMADGGEGTLEAFEVAFPSSVRHHLVVQGPAGSPVESSWLMLPDATAVVELANTSGITMLSTLLPLDAHTRGFGEAIASALNAGAQRLFLALGGSGSTDGGTAALTALGARFYKADGETLAPGNRALPDLAVIDRSQLAPMPPEGAVILADVTNPMLGAKGAAAVFGPQKGASGEEVDQMERGLSKLGEKMGRDPLAQGTGAAGGAGYGLQWWGATSVSGAEAVAAALGASAAIGSATVVVTGEGRYDDQTAAGKVVSHIRSLAKESGALAFLVAGVIDSDPTGFAASRALAEICGSTEAAMSSPLPALVHAGASLAQEFERMAH